MRYETGIPIGRGADSEVFKARDPDQDRFVALKIFAEDDEGRAARREREARVQAGLDHPSICEIFEVGRTPGGRGFIAMRYVDGEPLDAVCRRLPIRRRIELMKQVVGAVEAAHRAGLVHRDLKPSNLLVEEQADGSLRAFVLDFGIVRIAAETRLTETGHVLGTPGYLSPEQARGAEVDARSDIFSLGAVLYQILTGRMAFDATGVGAIFQVLEHEPPLAHAVHRETPAELAHIVQKAMEKDPKRRYPDAGALGRDLQRYLDGSATAARGVGILGRWVRRAERSPRLFLAGLLLLLLALGSSIWGVTGQLIAQRQTRDAEIFARRATEIEARARYAQLLPRHSIQPTRDLLLKELDRLAAEVARADGQAAAAGLYALGRAELALGRSDRAAEALRRSRDAGFDDPSWHLDLALALLGDARERLREVELQRDPEERRRLKARIRQDLRDRLPNLATLAGAELGPEGLGRGDQLMIRALDALISGQHDHTLEWAGRLMELEPWRFEAALILADTYREQATSTFMSEDADATDHALQSEEELLEQALLRAPSAPQLYRRLCENRMTAARADLEIGRSTEAWQRHFDDAETACAHAVEVQPDGLRNRSLAIEVRWRRLLAQLSRRGHAEELLQPAERLAADARALLDHPEAGYLELQNLGNALLAHAQALGEVGRPTPEKYEQAALALSRAIEMSPSSAFGRQSLGIAWTRHGQALDAVGKDPRASYGRAVEALHQGLNGIPSAEARVWNSICLTWTESAYYGLRHLDAVEPSSVENALNAGRDACERALRISPDYVSALSNLGMAEWTRVEWEVARGVDPSSTYDRAQGTFQRLFELNPEHVSGRMNFAGLVAVYARDRLSGQLLPGQSAAKPSEPSDAGLQDLITELRRARDWMLPLSDRFPFDADVHLGRLQILEAAALCASGHSSSATFAAAARSLRGLSTQGGWQSLRHLLWAQFHQRRAECRYRTTGSVAGSDLQDGMDAITKALEAEPSSTEAAEVKARIEALAAAADPSPEGDPN